MTQAAMPESVATPKIERYLRLSGLLVITGLIIEALSLIWSHPTAFLVFMFIGGALMGLGILIFLISLVWNDAGEPNG
jgi:hypothetical protein